MGRLVAAQEPSAARDDELVTALHRRFHGPLLSYTLSLTNQNRQLAERAVRETLLQAWRRAEELNGEPGLLQAWLFTLARRVVLDDWRIRQGRPDVIALALRRLPAEQREAMAQTYLRGHTVHEAATILGVPPTTVTSRIYNAMRTLSSALRRRGR